MIVVHALGCSTGDLLGRLDGHGPVAARRVYLMLHHVLKELASKRLAADQRNFAQVHALKVSCRFRSPAACHGVFQAICITDPAYKQFGVLRSSCCNHQLVCRSRTSYMRAYGGNGSRTRLH